jgi:hypothetical protein
VLVSLTTAMQAVGGRVTDQAIARLARALLDSDHELRERLDRVESKLDILINQPANVGRELLADAMKPHRSPGSARELIEQARIRFLEAHATTDSLSKSVAALYVAVCWQCLGQRTDASDWTSRASQEAIDGLYLYALRWRECNLTKRSRKRQLTELLEETSDWAESVRNFRAALAGIPAESFPRIRLIYYGIYSGYGATDSTGSPEVDVHLAPGGAVDIAGIQLSYQLTLLHNGAGMHDGYQAHVHVDVAQHPHRVPAPYGSGWLTVKRDSSSDILSPGHNTVLRWQSCQVLYPGNPVDDGSMVFRTLPPGNQLRLLVTPAGKNGDYDDSDSRPRIHVGLAVPKEALQGS